jgi:hypothetical protein
MPRVAGYPIIERPVGRGLDFVADERNEPRFNPKMLQAKKVSAGPIGIGTRFNAKMATARGSAPMTVEVTAFERPQRLASITRLSSMEIRGDLVFDPVPERARMRWQWGLQPRAGS